MRKPAANSGQPYRDSEIRLIVKTVPTWRNIKLLARVLGRSNDAIWMVYELVYRRSFRESKMAQETGGQGVAHQVDRIRRRVGLGNFG